MTERRFFLAAFESPAAFEAARAGGFSGVTLPSEARPGDRILLRVGPSGAFGAVLEAAGDEGGPATGVRVESAVPPGDYVETFPKLAALLEGASREVPREAYEIVSLEVERRMKGRRVPPGTPPTEAERRPKVPAKVKRRKDEPPAPYAS